MNCAQIRTGVDSALNTVVERYLGPSMGYEEEEKDHFIWELIASFEAEAVENGIYHPAEQIIASALQGDQRDKAMTWLRELSLNEADPSLASNVIRCLGRMSAIGSSKWRKNLIRKTLAIEHLEIRDAAAKAADTWSDTGLKEVLEQHSEPERWLQQYISEVIQDLKNETNVRSA